MGDRAFYHWEDLRRECCVSERNERAKSTGGVQFSSRSRPRTSPAPTPTPYTKHQMEKTKLSRDQQLGATSCSYSRRAGPSSEPEKLQDYCWGGDKGNTTFNLSTPPTSAHLSPIHPSTTTKYHQVVFCKKKKKEHIVMKWCTMWLSLHAKILFFVIFVVFFIDFVREETVSMYTFYCCMLGGSDGSLVQNG